MKIFKIFKNDKAIVKPIANKFEKYSYSQCGEDLIIDYIFKLRDIHTPNYLDIGANHPYFLNNTAIFYKRGCRGINIEANPDLLELLKKERPQDLNINIGVGIKNEILDFYVMEDNTLSTFSKDEANTLQKAGKKMKEIVKIEVKEINCILEEYFLNSEIDLLTIDIEGLDFEILKNINYTKFSPKIICVEAADYSPIGAGPRRDSLIKLLENQNYYEYACTNLNAIMVRKDFWFI